MAMNEMKLNFNLEFKCDFVHEKVVGLFFIFFINASLRATLSYNKAGFCKFQILNLLA